MTTNNNNTTPNHGKVTETTTRATSYRDEHGTKHKAMAIVEHYAPANKDRDGKPIPADVQQALDLTARISAQAVTRHLDGTTTARLLDGFIRQLRRGLSQDIITPPAFHNATYSDGMDLYQTAYIAALNLWRRGYDLTDATSYTTITDAATDTIIRTYYRTPHNAAMRAVNNFIAANGDKRNVAAGNGTAPGADGDGGGDPISADMFALVTAALSDDYSGIEARDAIERMSGGNKDVKTAIYSRAAGYTWAEIAAALEYDTPDAIRKAVNRAAAKYNYSI